MPNDIPAKFQEAIDAIVAFKVAAQVFRDAGRDEPEKRQAAETTQAARETTLTAFHFLPLTPAEVDSLCNSLDVAVWRDWSVPVPSDVQSQAFLSTAAPKSGIPVHPPSKPEMSGNFGWICDVVQARALKHIEYPRWDRIERRLRFLGLRWKQDYRPPLTEVAATAYQILLEREPWRGMRVNDLLDELSRRGHNPNDSKFYGRILPELKRWGVQNRRQVGYYVPASHRPIERRGIKLDG